MMNTTKCKINVDDNLSTNICLDQLVSLENAWINMLVKGESKSLDCWLERSIYTLFDDAGITYSYIT